MSTTTADVTLSKWGNSQGLRIPKEICDILGIKIGTHAKIETDQAKTQLVVTFKDHKQKYQRNRKISMEELCAEWDGGKVGTEWGGPDVGAEVVE